MCKRVQPALFTKESLPHLCHLWLDGQSVWAYDGELGINAPLKTDLRVGLPGAVLIGLVDKSKSVKEIELLQSDEAVTLKAGKMRTDLAYLPDSDRPQWPDDLLVDSPVPINQEFLSCLKAGMVATGNNENRPDFMGTTLIMDGEELQLYTSDGATASWLNCTLPENWEVPRVGWPRRFCEQLIKQADAKLNGKELLHMSRGSVLAELNETLILGRNLDIRSPINYEQMFSRMLPEDWEKKVYPIPKDFGEALGRSKVLLSKNKDAAIMIDADGLGKLVLSTVAGNGKVDDRLDIDGEQEPYQLRFTPRLIERVLPHVDRMYMGSRHMIFSSTSSGLVHIVSAG